MPAILGKKCEQGKRCIVGGGERQVVVVVVVVVVVLSSGCRHHAVEKVSELDRCLADGRKCMVETLTRNQGSTAGLKDGQEAVKRFLFCCSKCTQTISKSSITLFLSDTLP
jgi:hypothetical protein